MLDTVIVSKAADNAQVERNSVQVLPDAKKQPNAGEGDFFSFNTTRGPLLSPVGTQARARELYAYYHNQLNWMGQAAFAGLTKKWSSAAFQIFGKNRVDYFQSVLREADFRRGWTQFIQKVGLAYLIYDHGAWIEVIAPGNPMKPPTGPIQGLAVLDSLKVVPTGDPDYPALYTAKDGTRHLMHRTRVIQIVDAPEQSDRKPGYGKSALSRAIAIVSQQLHMNGYVDMKLDELPPPGYIIASNINKAQRDIALDNYIRDQNKDSAPVTGRTVWFYAVDPTAPADLKVITFAEPPESWDYEKYTELHANAWALALGVDIQEIWQLKSGNLGSSQQSQILDAKGKGKIFGAFLIEMERFLNDMLPLSLEFKFKVRDDQADAQHAQAANLWGTFVAQVMTITTPEEQRKLLAANVDAFRDAVTDAAGQIIKLEDADPKSPDQIGSDATPNAAPKQPAAAPPQNGDVAGQQRLTRVKATGDRAQFEDEFAAIVKSYQDGDLTQARARVMLRALIAKYGRKAYISGLNDGGIMRDEPTRDDSKALLLLLGLAAPFLKKFLAATGEASLSPDNLAAHAASWWSKSIQPFLDQGRLTANPAQLYEFVGPDGMESCATCQSLKGQKMSMAGWTAARLRPGTDTENFDCGGWHCQHLLVPVAKKEHAHA